MKYWYYVVNVQQEFVQKSEKDRCFLLKWKLSHNEELFPVDTALDFAKSLLDSFGKNGPAVELKMAVVNQIEISVETFENLKPPYVGF